MPVGPGADLYSPFMTAAIIDRQGNRYPMWTNITDTGTPNVGGKSTANNAGKYSLPFVTAMTVKLDLSYLPIISVTFSPPYDDAIALLDSPLIEWGVSKIQVQFGYTAGALNGPVLSPIFEGILMKPDITLGETIEITFQGQGTGGLSSTTQGSQLSLNTPTTVEAIITQLAAGPQGPGNPKRAFTVDFSKAELNAQTKTLLTQSRPGYQQGSATDYASIYYLLLECQCWSYFSQDENGQGVMNVISRNSSLTAPPKFTLSYFDMGGFPTDSGAFSKPGMLDPSQGQYPILSVSSQQMALYMAGAVRGFVANDVGSATGKQNQNVSKYTGTSLGAGSAGAASPAVNSTNTGANPSNAGGARTHFGNPELTENVLRQNAKTANATSLMGIPLSATTLGIPTMTPGDTVKIKGLGARLEANYAVMSLTHSISTDGFLTDVEMVGNLSAVAKGVTAAGPVNVFAPAPKTGPTANATAVPTTP